MRLNFLQSFMMALASMSPNSEIASLLFAVMFSFVIVFWFVWFPS